MGSNSFGIDGIEGIGGIDGIRGIEGIFGIFIRGTSIFGMVGIVRFIIYGIEKMVTPIKLIKQNTYTHFAFTILFRFSTDDPELRRVCGLWRFPETIIVGDRVNSVDMRSIVAGVSIGTILYNNYIIFGELPRQCYACLRSSLGKLRLSPTFHSITCSFEMFENTYIFYQDIVIL